ncbi:MAG: hypothetical protein ACRELG_22880 [Gemmataceae bacterium]
MTMRSAAASLALLLTPCFLLAPPSRASAAEGLFCPKTVFCRPKPPCIKYKRVCPKPICSCGEMENFGYYPTCWHPWPFPPNYCHCPVPPTIVTAPCSPIGAPKGIEQLPQPSLLPPGPSMQ